MNQKLMISCTGCGVELEASNEIVGMYMRCDQCDTKQKVSFRDQETTISLDPAKAKTFEVSKKSIDRLRKKQKRNKSPMLFILFTVIVGSISSFFIFKDQESPLNTVVANISDKVPVPKIEVDSSLESANIPEIEYPVVKISNSIKHFIRQRCQSCHGEKKQKGDQRFDDLPDELSKAHNIQLLQDILDTVNLSEMPPEEEPEIPVDELTNFIDELTKTITKAKEYTLNRGLSPPIRYLNKRELKLTYRDLLGVNVNLNQIPDAPEISRFDTIAKDQFFSESHWEASFNVAKSNLLKAVKIEGDAKTVKLRYEVETGKLESFREIIKSGPNKILEMSKKLDELMATQLKGHLLNSINKTKSDLKIARQEIDNPLYKTGALYSKNTLLMVLLGQNIYHFDKFKEGRYRLKIRCGTVHNKPDQQSFISTASHKQLINPEFQPYENFYQEIKGTPKNPEILSFYWNFGTQGSGRELLIDSDAQIWIDWIELEGPLRPIYQAKPEIEQLSTFDSWSIPKAVKIVKDFAYKAYRGRNISSFQLDQIKNHLMNQYQAGFSPQESLLDVLAVILSSPEFLYLVPEVRDSKNKELTSLSLANKLSYFLSSSQPDSELQNIVSGNKELNKESLRKECDRILDSEQSIAFIDAFVFQWLELSRFISVNPTIHAKRTNLIHWPRKQFHMLRESTEAMKYIVKNNLPITDLLNPSYYHIDNTLAKYYGLPVSNEKGYSARPLVDSMPRGGISSHAAFLIMTSRGNRTSPVERGVYLLRNILFAPPAPAPPNVPDLSASIKQTIKERFALKELNLSKSRQLMLFHTKQAQCDSCHRSFDPLGFALEGFDHFGAWRGEETNVKSTLPSGVELDGASGLRKYLINQQEQFIKGFIKTLMSYAIHRPVSIVDQAEIDEIYNANKPSGFRIRNIIKSIVVSKIFRGS